MTDEELHQTLSEHAHEPQDELSSGPLLRRKVHPAVLTALVLFAALTYFLLPAFITWFTSPIGGR